MAMENDRYVSVTRLTRYIKQMIETDHALQDIWLRGEISNFKRHSRGHLYLTLKDRNARIRAVMFAGNARRLNFEPEDGMKVLIQGSVSVYEPYGEYQLYIRSMEQDGLGRLFLAYEQLKKTLEARGWFDPSSKKKIPALAREIGIVTSPTGAAIRDLFTTIKRRFPSARLTVFPVLVQGAEAAPSIVRAIRLANRTPGLDLLIVGRGGGSIEDLWAFNEESVAEAIYRSTLPIISAVGHETDFTITDFVADRRAPTPTAAGEFAVPDVRELKRRIETGGERLRRAVRTKLDHSAERLRQLTGSYAFRYPEQLVLQKEQEYDRLNERFRQALGRQLTGKKDRLELNRRILSRNRPDALLERGREKLHDVTKLLIRAARDSGKNERTRYERVVLKLNALSPLRIMARGYSLAYDKDRRLIKSTRDVSPGDQLTLRMHDGSIDCQVWGLEEEQKHE
jgi:exodeoxyribonuclease VII large subunit